MMKRIALHLALALISVVMAGHSSADEPGMETLRDLCLDHAGQRAILGCSTAAEELTLVETQRLREAIEALTGPAVSSRALADAATLSNGFGAIGHGLEPDFSGLFVPVIDAATATGDMCAGLMLHTASAKPLAPVSLTLPPMLAQSDEQIFALAMTAGTVLPMPVQRLGSSSAVMLAPFDLAAPGEAATLELIVTTASALENGASVCAPMTFTVEPMEIQAGAGRLVLEAALDIPDRIARLGGLLDGDAPIEPEFAETLRNHARLSLDAYDTLTPEERGVLDMTAHAFALDTMAGNADRLEQYLASRRLQAGIQIRAASVLPPLGDMFRLAQTQSLVRPGDEGICPANPAELAQMMTLATHGAAHYRVDPDDIVATSTLFTAAQITTGVAIGLGVKAGAAYFGATAGATEATIASTGTRYSVRASASASMGFALWGVYMDYVKGMLPSRYSGLEVDVSRLTLTEDDFDPRITVDTIILSTTSRGWDASKAMLDVALAATGFFGVEGVVTGAVRSRLGGSVAAFGNHIIGNTAPAWARTGSRQGLSDALAAAGPTLAEVMEDTAGAMIGYIAGLGGTEAYQQLSPEGGALQVPPITCRIDMRDPEYSELEIENHHPDTFDITGNYEITGRFWGDATLHVLVHPDRHLPDPFRFRMSYSVSVDRARILPSYRQEFAEPGDAVALQADLAGVTREHQIVWNVETPGDHFLMLGDANAATLHTAGDDSTFPVTVSAEIDGTYLMPARTVGQRRAYVQVFSGGITLQADQVCIEPGQGVRMRVFDQVSGYEIARNRIRFDSAGGGFIGDEGIFWALETAQETTISAYLRDNEDFWAQTTIRIGNCACGAGFFDHAIVERSTPLADGYELLALRGTLTREISGSYRDTWVTRNMSLMAIQSSASLPVDSEVMAACIYAPAGPSAFAWPSVLNFGHTGPVFILDDSVADATQFAVGGQEIRSFAGEDLNGDGVISRTGEWGGLDDERFYAVGARLMFIERLDSGGVAMTYTVNMTTQRNSPDSELHLTYQARFETDTEAIPEPEPTPPPSGGGGRGARNEPLS